MVCQGLHVRLRQARERKGLTLTAIARAQGVREHNLHLIERDAFEDLPTGLYGRTAVRAYASAVGFDPDSALAEVAERVRTPEDPIDGLARVRGIERRPPLPKLWRGLAGALRVKAEPTIDVAPSVRNPVSLPISWRIPLAAVIDSVLLLAIDAGLIALTAVVIGVRPIELLHSALPAMLVVFVLIAGMYFILLGGVRRATIGAQLVQADPAEIVDGATVQAVMQRGWRYALDEGASLFGWLGRLAAR